ncbi:HlyD family efflux transporter periplasmic adaptor subunit [Caldichromatium japonicum]|uniref:HlyD family efflux transporter periplasmic adaptor subunit n=1 Tax=Caldichromatium japonicum TaxID=2699430 RepID=A0A6G7VF14_9GAMM|nr:HlyD family efflux transporter periplasmic adaptor subunit [Caldichromatium japonicum]QIK38673.1 HlyD family efflux transporter periplasmic adaptor subunit [Caldichromatium japonicum]
MSRPIPRLLLPFLILAVGIGGSIVLKATRPRPHPVPAQERVWRVAVVYPTPAAYRPVLSLFGRSEAPDRIRATAPFAGRLLEVRVRDGETVEAGAMLARLDPKDIEPRVAKARAEVERERLRFAHDRAALEQEREILRLAQLALERAQSVQSKQLGSEASVDTAREQYARARLAVTLREQAIAEHPARLEILEAALAEAERDQERALIRSPFAARIGTVEAAAGDQLQPNQPILTLYPRSGLYVRAKIPGAYAAELRIALAQNQRLAAQGEYAGWPFVAVLERLSGEADARGVDALLQVAPGIELPLGAFVTLALERPPAPGTIALPLSALHGAERIFAVRDGRLKALDIERVGELADGRAVLRVPGLEPGEAVMVTHLPHAIEALKVEVVETLAMPDSSTNAERTLSPAGAQAPRTPSPAQGSVTPAHADEWIQGGARMLGLAHAGTTRQVFSMPQVA